MASEPSVSVVVRACAGHLPAATLESALGQLFVPTEILVVHDERHAADLRGRSLPRDPRIRWVASPDRDGAGAALNAGIAAARGRYVAFLEPGVRWTPWFLQELRRRLDDNGAATAVCAGDPGAPITLTALIEQSCRPALPAVLIRRPALVDAGGFDRSLRSGCVFDLWLRLVHGGASILVHHDSLVTLPSSVPTSEQILESVEASITVLQRFDQRHLLDRSVHTALRVRTMHLIDRLEIEQAKCRMLEGHLSAAAFHLSSARERSWAVLCALVAIRVAPRATHVVYKWFNSVLHNRDAASLGSTP